MKITKNKTIYLLSILALFAYCTHSAKDQTKTKKVKEIDNVLTKADLDALTPDKIITSLKEGNVRFSKNMLTPRNYTAQAKASSKGQYPEAIILACVDSRVPVETIFDRGIGDVFVARVAGNVANVDILGSMEYACKVAGSKLVVVMGHQHCGAVKSAVKNVELGNITPLLSKIKPAISAVKEDGDRTVKNKKFLHEVGVSNVKNTIKEIRENSNILKQMEEEGKIKIVGAMYNITNGQVTFL